MSTTTTIDEGQYIRLDFKEDEIRAIILEGDFSLKGDSFYFKLIIENIRAKETLLIRWFSADGYDEAFNLAKSFFFDNEF